MLAKVREISRDFGDFCSAIIPKYNNQQIQFTILLSTNISMENFQN